MKGQLHPTNDASLNPSSTPTIRDVIDSVDPSRRKFIQSGLSGAALASVGGLTLSGIATAVHAAPVPPGLGFAGIGFESVPPNVVPLADKVSVPAGYTAQLFVAWGDPIMPGGKPFSGDATETAADQLQQFGAHNDGMHLFPFTDVTGKPSSDRGLFVANHEYTQESTLYRDGQVGNGYTIAKTRKSQAAHGVSVVEARKVRGNWSVVKGSRYGRRITGNTFMRVSGPAAGHALMRANEYKITDTGSLPTGQQTDGMTVYGTLNNCGHGVTPWGTYLTGEENWNGYFGSTSGVVDTDPATELGRLNRRYGLSAGGFGYLWHTTDERFDLSKNPNEPHLQGWVTEIDPFNPQSTPVKRTWLGRFKHEGAWCVVDSANRLGVYMGDDERNEYIYKFVARRKFNPNSRFLNRNLLDDGMLYAAKFNADGTGQWLALAPDTLGVDGVALRDHPNFAGANDAEVQAKILVKTRMAADAVGATMMDRPEWTGARPRIGGFGEVEVYSTLTNNTRRGTTTESSNAADGSTAAGSARPPVDAANPREDNVYGGVIRWREDGRSCAATGFTWDLFIQGGDSATTKTAKPTNDYKGNLVADPAGSADYGAPDGLWFDDFGRLWVQTDQSGDGLGDWANIGSNGMVCVDPNTGTTRRFLAGPPDCEVTGVVLTPDGKTMFCGIQHPGDSGSSENPTLTSDWPASQWAVEADGVTKLPAGRPRSAVVVITKDDGGIIGS